MNNFIYENKTKLFFGKGGMKEYLACLLNQYGKTVLLISAQNEIIHPDLIEILKNKEKNIIELKLTEQANYGFIQNGVKLVHENQVDFILAVGDGKLLDCAKCISAQVKCKEDLWNLEILKHTYPQDFLPLGFIATGLNGAYGNDEALIYHEEKKERRLLLGAAAEFVFLDPMLMMNDKALFSEDILNLLSYAIEIDLTGSSKSQVSDACNLSLIQSLIVNTRSYLKNPNDYEIRSELVWTMLLVRSGLLKMGKGNHFQLQKLAYDLSARLDCDSASILALLLYQFCLMKHKRIDEIKNLEAFLHELGYSLQDLDINSLSDYDLKFIAASNGLSCRCAKGLYPEEIEEVLKACKENIKRR